MLNLSVSGGVFVFLTSVLKVNCLGNSYRLYDGIMKFRHGRCFFDFVICRLFLLVKAMSRHYILSLIAWLQPFELRWTIYTSHLKVCWKNVNSISKLWISKISNLTSECQKLQRNKLLTCRLYACVFLRNYRQRMLVVLLRKDILLYKLELFKIVSTVIVCLCCRSVRAINVCLLLWCVPFNWKLWIINWIFP